MFGVNVWKCLKEVHVKKLSLTENMRAGDEKAQAFAEKRLQFGNDTYSIDPHSGKIDEMCNILNTYIDKVYPLIQRDYVNKE